MEPCIRALRHGDVATVARLFARLGERSRRARFNGPKPRLTQTEVAQLAAVDTRRQALVAYVDGDPQPVALGHLVRDGSSAEVAFAVADEYQRQGIGSALAAELIAAARAAGITEVTALVASDNDAAIRVLCRVANCLDFRLDGPELSIRAAIA
jgi:ribosomal protein S18 acetylase RimI-like enzyme